MTAAGAAAVAVPLDVFEFASSLFGAEPKPREKPLICVAFALRKEGGKWWPAGTTAQLEQIRAQYETILTDAAKKLNVRLDILPEPLKNDAAYLEHDKQGTAQQTGDHVESFLKIFVGGRCIDLSEKR